MNKNKSFKKYFAIFFLFLTIFFISKSVFAQEAKIDFVDEPTYHLNKKTDAGYFYIINVTLKNNGDVKSCPIDIKIVENGFDSVFPEDCQSIIFLPDEQKSFFIDWSTPHIKDQIEVTYTASEPNNITTDNTGKITINIDYKNSNSNKGIPGFGIIISLISLIILIEIKKKKGY